MTYENRVRRKKFVATDEKVDERKLYDEKFAIFSPTKYF